MGRSPGAGLERMLAALLLWLPLAKHYRCSGRGGGGRRVAAKGRGQWWRRNQGGAQEDPWADPGRYAFLYSNAAKGKLLKSCSTVPCYFGPEYI